jgi:hypothetical protein
MPWDGCSPGGSTPPPTPKRYAMSGTESNPRTRALESAKIADAHRAKLAVVYVRQS